jgi:hypothetical protein
VLANLYPASCCEPGSCPGGQVKSSDRGHHQQKPEGVSESGLPARVLRSRRRGKYAVLVPPNAQEGPVSYWTVLGGV